MSKEIKQKSFISLYKNMHANEKQKEPIHDMFPKNLPSAFKSPTVSHEGKWSQFEEWERKSQTLINAAHSSKRRRGCPSWWFVKATCSRRMKPGEVRGGNKDGHWGGREERRPKLRLRELTATLSFRKKKKNVWADDSVSSVKISIFEINTIQLDLPSWYVTIRAIFFCAQQLRWSICQS